MQVYLFTKRCFFEKQLFPKVWTSSFEIQPPCAETFKSYNQPITIFLQINNNQSDPNVSPVVPAKYKLVR